MSGLRTWIVAGRRDREVRVRRPGYWAGAILTGVVILGSAAAPAAAQPAGSDAPIGVTATGGDTQAVVSFTLPATADVVQSYTVAASDVTDPSRGGQISSGSDSPITATSLTNGDSYTFTVTANYQDGPGAASDPSDPVVVGVAPSISGTPPSGTAGTPYIFTFAVTGDPAPTVDPYGPAQTSGGGFPGPCGVIISTSGPKLGLPPGLTLSSTGVLSGTPTAPGQYAFTPEATNAVATTYGNQVTITIAPAAAASVTISAGNGQNTAPGAAFSNLSVIVTDASGQPVVGRTVTFTVTSGAATFFSPTSPSCTSSTATAVTNSAGVATSPTLTAGMTTGPVTVTATTSIADGTTVGTTFMETVGTPGPARADLTVTLTAPGTISRGAVGTVKITVTNKGPSAATKIAAAVYIPPTFTVTNTGGGTTTWGVTVFTVPTLAPAMSTTFTVTVKAGNRTGRSVLAAITAATTTDPNLYNNIAAAISTIK
jgi:Domain of unknown function DUF11